MAERLDRGTKFSHRRPTLDGYRLEMESTTTVWRRASSLRGNGIAALFTKGGIHFNPAGPRSDNLNMELRILSGIACCGQTRCPSHIPHYRSNLAGTRRSPQHVT